MVTMGTAKQDSAPALTGEPLQPVPEPEPQPGNSKAAARQP